MLKTMTMLLIVTASGLAGCNDKYPDVDWSRVIETPQDPPYEQLQAWMDSRPASRPGWAPDSECFLIDHRSGPHWNSTTDQPYRVGDVDRYTAVFFFSDWDGDDLVAGSVGIYGAFRLVKGSTTVLYEGPDTGQPEGKWFHGDFYVQAWRTGEGEIGMHVDTTYGPTPTCYVRLFDVEA